MGTDNQGYRITDEERDFLFDKAKEIDNYCEQHGIRIIKDIKGLHAFRTPSARRPAASTSTSSARKPRRPESR